MLLLFNGISTFVGYLMSKFSLWKRSGDIVQPKAGGNEGVYTFPKDSLKFNVIAWLDFELTKISQSDTKATTPQKLVSLEEISLQLQEPRRSGNVK